LADEAVTGLILAGGAGSRMGGADKGLIEYRGKPLIAHVIERFAPQVDRLIISANRNLERYRAFGYPVVSDATPERLGPLAGIAAGLRVCATPWLAVAPCDGPALPDDLVARLLAASKTAPLAIAATAEGLQPAYLLCRSDCLPALEAYLASGRHTLRDWCRLQQAVIVPFPDAAAFRNLNTPADLGD
jgi:molybdopterin-guanine dinucleotide biosynthesis protein A